MSSQTASTPAQASTVWRLVHAWAQRARQLGAIGPYPSMPSDQRPRLLLGGDDCAFDVQVDIYFVWLLWHTSPYEWRYLVKATQTEGLQNGDKPWEPEMPAELAERLITVLQPGAVEVTPPERVLYGFVENGRIVAVTYIGWPGPSQSFGSQMIGEPGELAQFRNTFVADTRAFQRLCPPSPTVAAWYTQFWELQARGTVVKLAASGLLQGSQGSMTLHQEGSEAWLQLQRYGGVPAFLASERYVSWDVMQHQPRRWSPLDEGYDMCGLNEWFM